MMARKFISQRTRAIIERVKYIPCNGVNRKGLNYLVYGLCKFGFRIRLG
jgi:hypothetical protein